MVKRGLGDLCCSHGCRQRETCFYDTGDTPRLEFSVNINLVARILLHHQTRSCRKRLQNPTFVRSSTVFIHWISSGFRRQVVGLQRAPLSRREVLRRSRCRPRLDIISISHPLEFPNNNNCYYIIVVTIIIPVRENRSCYDLSPPRITSAINKI